MSLDVSNGRAFVAGLLSFALPCVLPLVPPYLAYMGGISIDQLREPGSTTARTRVLLVALSFVAGFSTVFVALGATASWIGQAVSAHLGLLSYLAGALIVLMGLHFLHAIRIPLLDRTVHFGVVDKPAGLAGGDLVDGGRRKSAAEGARLLFVYSLGIGMPFLIAAAFAPGFMRAIARFRSRLDWIEKAMGKFLIAAGVVIFTGQMPVIAFWLIETFPALGKIGRGPQYTYGMGWHVRFMSIENIRHAIFIRQEQLTVRARKGPLSGTC